MQRGITGQSAENSLKIPHSTLGSLVKQPLLTSRLREHLRKRRWKEHKNWRMETDFQNLTLYGYNTHKLTVVVVT